MSNIGVGRKACRGFLPLVGRPGLCIFTGGVIEIYLVEIIIMLRTPVEYDESINNNKKSFGTWMKRARREGGSSSGQSGSHTLAKRLYIIIFLSESYGHDHRMIMIIFVTLGPGRPSAGWA